MAEQLQADWAAPLLFLPHCLQDTVEKSFAFPTPLLVLGKNCPQDAHVKRISEATEGIAASEGSLPSFPTPECVGHSSVLELTSLAWTRQPTALPSPCGEERKDGESFSSTQLGPASHALMPGVTRASPSGQDTTASLP